MCNTRNPQIDLGLDLLMHARQTLANETGQSIAPLTNAQIAEVITATTGTPCTGQAISYYSSNALRKLRHTVRQRGLELEQF